MDNNVEILLVIFGAVLCLGGWVVFWFSTRLIGISSGLGLGFSLGTLFAALLNLHGTQQQVALLVTSFIGAAIGFMLARFATLLLFALVGLLFGAFIGRVGVQAYLVATTGKFVLNAVSAGVIIGTGVVFGLMAAFFQKSIVIVVTSFAGAAFLVSGLPIRPDHEIWVFLLLFLAAVAWQAILVTQLLTDSPKTQSQD